MKRLHHQIMATLGTVGLCAATLGLAGPANADPAPYENSVTGTTSTYASVGGSYTWEQAKDAAAATPAPSGCTNHLAVITSSGEQLYINNSLGQQQGQFIGAQRVGDGSTFGWVTNESFDFANWADGEPNNTFPGEPYVQLTGGGAWNDIFADFYSGYILETECSGPVTPAPLAVTSVNPSSGQQPGGNTVTITGSGFTGASSVSFGAKKATFTVVSDTEITATVPAPGGKVPAKGKKVHVVVKVGKSKSAKSSADFYTYTQSTNT